MEDEPVSGKLGHTPKLVGEGDVPLDMVSKQGNMSYVPILF